MSYLYIKKIFYTNVINNKFQITQKCETTQKCEITHCGIVSKSGEYLYDITDLIKQYNVNLDTPIDFYRGVLEKYENYKINNKEHIIIIVFNGDEQIEYEL